MYTPLDPLVDLAWFGPIFCHIAELDKDVLAISVLDFIFLHVLGFKKVIGRF